MKVLLDYKTTYCKSSTINALEEISKFIELEASGGYAITHYLPTS